jgi:hypothetical protein
MYFNCGLKGLMFIPQTIYGSGEPMILAGKTEELGENLVPVPFCPPQIPHRLTRE